MSPNKTGLFFTIAPFLLGGLGALAYWLIDALLYRYPFGAEGNYLDALLPLNEPATIWIRVSVTLALLLLGSFGSLLQQLGQGGRKNRDSIVEQLDDAYVQLDRRWRPSYLNPQARQLFESSRKHSSGGTLWERCPGFHDQLAEALELAMEENEPLHVSQYMPDLGRHLDMHAYPFADGMALFLRDITNQYQREEELRESNQRLQAVLDSANDAILTLTSVGLIITINRAGQQLFGYHEHEVLGRDLNELLPGWLGEPLEQYISHHRDNPGEETALRELEGVRNGGERFAVELTTSLIRRGNVLLFLITARDVSGRKAREQALSHSEAMLKKAQAIAHVGSWEWLPGNNRLYWSDELYRIHGYTPGEIEPSHCGFLADIHEDDRQLVQEAVNHSLQNHTPYRIEYRIERTDGEVRNIIEQGEPTHDNEGNVTSVIATVQDVTGHKRTQAALEYMSNYDALTDLPNRSLLHERLKHALELAHRQEQLVAVMFLDLDRFKNINDSLGHGAGDELLKAVAQRLQANVRESDTVARLGGDEFVIILESITHVDDAAVVAQSLIEAMNEPHLIDGHEIVVGTSIGITIYPFDDDNIDDLLRDADTAMYRAKSEGRNNYQYFTSDMTSEARKHMELERDLRRALENSDFQLYYQPQVEIGSGRVCGMEALLRWVHPDRGMIPPAEFIPVLEETGLIHAAGEWVLREACRQNRAWQEAGLKPFKVAINVSARQFRQQDFPDLVGTALQEFGLDGHYLELEITEGLLVDNLETTIGQLRQLNAMGVTVSVDDFGTGYSSMGYLKRLPLHTLKVDQSFVRDIGKDDDDDAITRAIIALAHSLRLEVIAEGVETEAQLEFLKNLGCNFVQGYLISRPMPAEKVTDWLRKNNEKAQAV